MARADISAKIVVPKPCMRGTTRWFSGTGTIVGDTSSYADVVPARWEGSGDAVLRGSRGRRPTRSVPLTPSPVSNLPANLAGFGPSRWAAVQPDGNYL
jgi:hypothetical protein